jgi:four helix bundle protein
MTDRPAYKTHPLWMEAMSLTREAYALSERLRERDPETSRRLRRAAVAVPAHVASALSAEPERRSEPMLAARGALAEVSRHATRAVDAGSDDLLHRVWDLDRRVLFELGAPDLAS